MPDEIVFHDCDVLVLGGGAAGCVAAIEASAKNENAEIIVMDKANVERSGCLAGGMNAINAYLHPGETPESFAKYVRYDARGLIREDLVLSIARELNAQVKRLEQLGIPIKKDAQGAYEKRGRWNVKINGERLKPALSDAAKKTGAKILNHVVATSLAKINGKISGAFGLGLRDGKLRAIRAKATIVATGGCSGIYRPNNPGSGKNKTWYSPFNTGTGYAMGLRAGAEMTSLEMRFIALRTKDVICPTGTLALGFGAKQANALGEQYMGTKYSQLGGEGSPTCIRAFAPTLENKEGRGPCFLDATHLNPEQVRALKESYLDMYPSIILYWAANNFDPSKEKIEICGTEPYLVGGHCQAGYWVSEKRETTLAGLFAAGDVAGGAPFKFVSGAMAEGAIAARNAVQFAQAQTLADENEFEKLAQQENERAFAPIQNNESENAVSPREFDERLQKIMDEYAGGISACYELSEEKLKVARRKLADLGTQEKFLAARDLHDLMLAHAAKDKLLVARALAEHLLYRKETRWPGFQTRTDFPEKDDGHFGKIFVNSTLENNEIKIIERPYGQIVPGDRYAPR